MAEPSIEIPHTSEPQGPLSPVDRYRRDIIGLGEELVRQRKYRDALQMLGTNTDVTREAGIMCSPARSFIANKAIADDELRGISDQVAYASQCSEPTEYDKSRRLHISGYYDPKNLVPEILWHDAALVALEEHLHAVQSMTDNFITIKQRPPDSILDRAELMEIDVVYTLISDGVPIDEFFLARHGRERFLKDFLKRGMKLVRAPLGIGSIVKVERSNGRIEDGWQVVEILPDKFAVVHDADNKLRKEVPLSMLESLRGG